MYGDISEFMERAASASIISLYEIVGYPDGRIPDPVSWDKFHSTYGHLRRVVGWLFNTRTLTFRLPDDKRTALADLLATWIKKRITAFLKLPNSMASLLTRPVPIAKVARCSLPFKMPCAAPSTLVSTRYEVITSACPKHITSERNSQSTSTAALTH